MTSLSNDSFQLRNIKTYKEKEKYFISKCFCNI